MGIWGKIFGDESDAQPKNFQVTFNAHKLGMTLAAASDGTPVVTKGEFFSCCWFHYFVLMVIIGNVKEPYR